MNDNKAFLDTCFLIALFNKDDLHHDEALKLFNSMKGKRKLEISDYVLDELLTFVRRKIGTKISIEVLESLLSSRWIITARLSEADFETACEIFRTYSKLSFTDSSSVAFMLDKNIEQICSFDSGFDSIPDVVRVF